MNVVALPAVKFENIREHAGSQHRAWEELAFILTPTLDGLPTNCRIIRRGTPDGGVEFHSEAPDGQGTWAWQAKYLFDLSASTYTQMTKSVKDALANVPSLSRYAFILPVDRPAGAHGVSAMKRWNEKVDEWTDYAKKRGVIVEFEFYGHSDVLKALLKPEHAGAHRYFFDSDFLSPEAFTGQVERAATNLGDRYLPRTNVATDFPEVIDALCLTPVFKDRVRDAAAKSERALDRLVRALKKETNVAVPETEGASTHFARVRSRCKELLGVDSGDGLPDLRQAAFQAEDAVRGDWQTFEKVGMSSDGRKAYNPRDSLSEALRALQVLGALLNDSALKLSGHSPLLVVGAAGVGKSHSLADIAMARTKAGAPTCLVLGNLLSTNTSLSDELARFIELGPWRDLIDGLQVAAQLSGKGRALIVVDAINEGPGGQLWKDRLPGLLKELERAPGVALALSIRDSYERTVVSEAAGAEMERVVHRGLVGRESEAIHVYAEDSGLSAPQVPPLNPEFSNPLLLRSMCRAAKARGLTSVPDTSMGEDWIFDGLLAAINQKVSSSDQLDLDEDEQLVQKYVRAVAGAMVDANAETLPRRIAAEIGSGIFDDGGRQSRRLVSVLEREGVLLREPSRESDGDVTRFTYQRMSDHYRARVLLERCDEAADLRAGLITYHAARGWMDGGMLEALSSMVPVRFDFELVDLVVDDAWVERAKYTLGRALLDSVAWRPPSSISERTAGLVSDLIDDEVIEYSEWLSTLLGVACVPGHPLGADFIHKRLIGMSMLESDEAWTIWVQDVWLEWDNPVARMLDWLSSNDAALSSHARQDSMLLVAWFLSSTSRRLRDSATKVLVTLTDRRADGLLHVLRRMRTVNDPYIRERLAAVALGFACRLPNVIDDPEQRQVVEGVHAAALEMASHGPVASVLLTHYMRELSREVSVRLPGVEVGSYDEPTATWPPEPPSRTELAARLGSDSDRQFLRNSPIGYDFRRYTLERVVENFALPNHDELQRVARQAVEQERVAALRRIAEAEEVTVQEVENFLYSPDHNRSFDDVFGSVETLLESYGGGGTSDTSGAKQERTHTEGERIRNEHPDDTRRITNADGDLRSPKNIGPTIDMVERWLVDRVLNLGWSSDSGEEKYNYLRNGQLGGAEDKVERRGKKYLWIALRELQAILVQHCRVADWSLDTPVAFESAWQLREGVDIDPTVALRGDRPPTDSSSARLRRRQRDSELAEAWWLHGFASPLDAGATNDDAWLQDDADLPLLGRILSVTDPVGDKWVVLESHVTWKADTDDAVESFRQDRREMWLRSQSYLTPTKSIVDLRAWSKGKDWMGLWMHTPPDHGQGFFRQYPDAQPWAGWFRESLEEHTAGWDGESAPTDSDRFRVEDGWYQPSVREFPQYPQALATFARSGIFESDMSAKDSPSSILPSPTLLDVLGAWHTSADRMNVEPTLGLGGVEREYSWSTSDGIVMFSTGGSDWDNPSALLVRASALYDALKSRGLSWWSWALGEKITWRRGEPTANRLNVFGAAGLSETGIETWSLDSRYRAGPD